MGFNFIYWTPAVFPAGYGWIGEIPHGRLWQDWGLRVNLSNISMYLEALSVPHGGVPRITLCLARECLQASEGVNG